MRPSRIVSGVSLGWMMRAVMPSVQAEAETRSVFGFRFGGRPVAGRALVLYQAVCGGGVRLAQQGLCPHHEGEVLPWRWKANRHGGNLRYRRSRRVAASNGLDQAGGKPIDARFCRSRTRRPGQQSERDFLVWRRVGRIKAGRAERGSRISARVRAKERVRGHPMLRLGLRTTDLRAKEPHENNRSRCRDSQSRDGRTGTAILACALRHPVLL